MPTKEPGICAGASAQGREKGILKISLGFTISSTSIGRTLGYPGLAFAQSGGASFLPSFNGKTGGRLAITLSRVRVLLRRTFVHPRSDVTADRVLRNVQNFSRLVFWFTSFMLGSARGHKPSQNIEYLHVDRGEGGREGGRGHRTPTPRRNLSLYHIRQRTQGERFQRRVVLRLPLFRPSPPPPSPWQVLWLYTIAEFSKGDRNLNHTPRSFCHSFITTNTKHPGSVVDNQHNSPSLSIRGSLWGLCLFSRAAYFHPLAFFFLFSFLLFLSWW